MTTRSMAVRYVCQAMHGSSPCPAAAGARLCSSLPTVLYRSCQLQVAIQW